MHLYKTNSDPRVTENMVILSLCIWVSPNPNLILYFPDGFWSIYLLEGFVISFFLAAEEDCIVYTHRILTTREPVDGIVGGVCLLATGSTAALKMDSQVSQWWTQSPLGARLRAVYLGHRMVSLISIMAALPNTLPSSEHSLLFLHILNSSCCSVSC